MNTDFTPIYDFFIEYGLNEFWSAIARASILVILLFIFAGVLYLIGNRVFLKIINRLTQKSKTNYDDIFYKNQVFKKLSLLFPALAIYAFNDVILHNIDLVKDGIFKATNIYVIAITASIINATLKSLQEIFESQKSSKDKPLTSYRQVLTIINMGVALISIVSIIIGKSPLYLFSTLGALTAIILLVFKDTILGFVASIQLSSNDMVRVGDWISVDSYGADGNVLEINLSTVKVKNFDNTVTTVPTYTLISNSFKNWRGMEESNGRRIKRKIIVSIPSIKICNEALLKRMSEVDYIESYISKKIKEIDAFNKSAVKNPSSQINGRNLTNVGLFRQYLHEYIKSNPQINTNLTCMIRQLEPCANGLPLEVYCFSKDKAWVNYEAIQADIFDHIIAVAKYFEIELFQTPSGDDFRKLVPNTN